MSSEISFALNTLYSGFSSENKTVYDLKQEFKCSPGNICKTIILASSLALVVIASMAAAGQLGGFVLGGCTFVLSIPLIVGYAKSAMEGKSKTNLLGFIRSSVESKSGMLLMGARILQTIASIVSIVIGGLAAIWILPTASAGLAIAVLTVSVPALMLIQSCYQRHRGSSWL